jgi:hypothetical protein
MMISTRRFVLPDALLQRREDFIPPPFANEVARPRMMASGKVFSGQF